MKGELICANTVYPIAESRVYERSQCVPDLKRWGYRISAFIPIYYNGNASLVALEEGELWIVPWKAKVLHRKIAKDACVDLVGSRRVHEDHLHRSLYVPLVALRYSAVYVQLKVRNPYTRNDGATGFFRVGDIQSVVALNANDSVLCLKQGVKFHICMTKPQVHRRISDAQMHELVMKNPPIFLDI